MPYILVVSSPFLDSHYSSPTADDVGFLGTINWGFVITGVDCISNTDGKYDTGY